mgnify:CR=1 FL=1
MEAKGIKWEKMEMMCLKKWSFIKPNSKTCESLPNLQTPLENLLLTYLRDQVYALKTTTKSYVSVDNLATATR